MENNLTTSLKGLNALVCGSTSGIGKSTAIEFSQLGANVTLFARNERKLNASLSLLKNDGNQTHQYLVGDFDDADQIKTTISEHISSGNSYHILVNNQVHESVGGQATSARFIDIPDLVKANGYNNVFYTDNEQELTLQINELINRAGPNFLEVLVKPGSRNDLGRPTVNPADNKSSFMDFVQEK